VSIVGFVLPPLFCIQLSNQSENSLIIDSAFLCDVGVLILGITTTAITSSLTFHDLFASTDVEKGM